MVAVENICKINLVESKTLTRFAVRIYNTVCYSIRHTGINRNIAGLHSGISSGNSRYGFAKHRGSSASFIVLINQIFSPMRTVKNLTQTPKVCSVSTSNARKSVTSKSVTITPNLLYQITMKLTVSSDGADGRVRRCGVIHTDIYQAASENEAMGLALTTVRGKYGAFYDIDLHSITRERTYRAIQQQSQQPQHPWQR